MILSKPIVLVGMMGCGKSTIGKIVAEKLNRFFLDSDKEIEYFLKKVILNKGKLTNRFPNLKDEILDEFLNAMQNMKIFI